MTEHSNTRLEVLSEAKAVVKFVDCVTNTIFVRVSVVFSRWGFVFLKNLTLISKIIETLSVIDCIRIP